MRRKHQQAYEPQRPHTRVSWARVRAAFLLSAPMCETCHEAGRTTPATHVVHREKRAQGRQDTLDNLVALCAGCHQRTLASDKG